MPTALISVYDKSGVAELASTLQSRGWSIISSGGTAAALAEAGVKVTDVADITGSGAILGHRVVTLHPRIHAAILADLSEPSHRDDLARLGVDPISLVVVNLYPFSDSPSVELIDIGGPAMVRGAAKNHAHVGVVVRPDDYGRVTDEIEKTGSLSVETRRDLARIAFSVTADYDRQIAAWLTDDDAPLPSTLTLVADKAQDLRYGENPHQQGARYRFRGGRSWWDEARQWGGKELSYLNVYDTDAAWNLVDSFTEPACVIVKHANPCGVAVAASIADAYARANACDPVSAFGGIVALNRDVDDATAKALANVFTEVIVAPGYSPTALAVLQEKKNLRIISGPSPVGGSLDVRAIDGGLLVQTPDRVNFDRASWTVVTDRQPAPSEWDDLEFAWRVGARVSSNAIVFAKDRQAFGIGAGQQNRLDSARIAAERAAGRARGGVCASDAFFPFRDGLDAAASAGIVAVIQPGGSVRDAEVIAAANEHGMAMVFTGERHFRH